MRIVVYDQSVRMVPAAGLSRVARLKLGVAAFAVAVLLIALVIAALVAAFAIAIPLILVALFLVVRTLWRAKNRGSFPPIQ